jgi:chorismate lyase / 3-hydroxybenzoate synthase
MSLNRAEAQADIRRGLSAARQPEPTARLLGALRTELPTGERPFFTLRFGSERAPAQPPDQVLIPLPVLGAGPDFEVWTGAPVTRLAAFPGGGLVASPDYLGLYRTAAVAPGGDVSAATSEIYHDLLGRQRELGYPNLVRMWNVVPELNAGDGDAEAYVRFNVGRAAAFDALGLPEVRYSAATCVGGAAGTPLTVLALASRIEPVSIENPRQVSAYQYPRQYGPRAPSFARATLLPDAGGGTLFISGTASIVGHESRHDDVGPQVAETLANIDRLREQAVAMQPGLRAGARQSWRVYLRDPADFPAVQGIVHDRLGGAGEVVFLQADICRRELKVEIEGVCELLRPHTASGS